MKRHDIDSSDPRLSASCAVKNGAVVAWCGWSLPVPEEWEPLKIEGGWKKGAMMIGRAGEPMVLLKWWRPEDARFNAPLWLSRRFGALAVIADSDAPRPAGFSHTGWVLNLENKDGSSKSVWYGYAPSAGLVVECISTSLVDPAWRDSVFTKRIPALSVTAREAPVLWSFFSTRFVTPAGYRLVKHKLALGDMGLDLQSDTGARAIVRQVFPAGLALHRRPIDDWLATSPFMERREMGAPVSRIVSDDGVVRQRGWKRLPAPLGWLKPRYCDRAATVDQRRDRLCIAEVQDRQTFGTEAIAAMMGAMQR